MITFDPSFEGAVLRVGATYPLRRKNPLRLIFHRLLEERLARDLQHRLGQVLLPVEAEPDRVALLEPAADPGTVLLNQAVVPAASREDVLDLLVVQAREEDAPAEGRLVDAAERGDVDLAGQVELFGVVVDLAEVGQGGGDALGVFCSREEVSKFGNGLARGICSCQRASLKISE